MAPRLYVWLRPLGRLLVRIFYRRVEVRGAEWVPSTGPLLIAANHPNMFLDPLLVATAQPRAVSFLAKATLFRSPLLGSFLSACGVLPVYRRSDSPGESRKNVLTFEAGVRHLERGGAIGIFPEGLSHDRQAVMPLKTGCARLALEAEEKNGFRLGVKIVPVGLYFPERHIFRSEAVVVFDRPIEPAEHARHYQENPHEAVRRLTGALQERLEAVSLHVEQEEDEALLAPLREILAPAAILSERREADLLLADAIEHFRASDPERYARLRRRLLSYRRLLSVLGIRHTDLARGYRWGPVLGYLLPRLALGLIGLPVYIFGAAGNFLPYRIPAWISRWMARELEEIATVKLLSGMVTFPLFYALESAAAARYLGWAASAAFLTALAPAGLLALAYQEAMSDLLQETRTFFLHLLRGDAVSRLAALGRELAREIERCREEYLARPAEE
jgi:1-acyl-sn-glycerol-3-phosphate acyltransferase